VGKDIVFVALGLPYRENVKITTSMSYEMKLSNFARTNSRSNIHGLISILHIHPSSPFFISIPHHHSSSTFRISIPHIYPSSPSLISISHHHSSSPFLITIPHHHPSYPFLITITHRYALIGTNAAAVKWVVCPDGVVKRSDKALLELNLDASASQCQFSPLNLTGWYLQGCVRLRLNTTALCMKLTLHTGYLSSSHPVRNALLMIHRM
jgi:hypothetical protein